MRATERLDPEHRPALAAAQPHRLLAGIIPGLAGEDGPHRVGGGGVIIGMEQLQAAFANIYATMDSIDEFKLKALDTMSTTIGVLEADFPQSEPAENAGAEYRLD